MYYAPDPSIVKQLKACDQDLDARWDQDEERWWITCKGRKTIKVQNNDGSYRPLDGRIVSRMREEAWVYRNKYGKLHMHDKQLLLDGVAHQRKHREQERDNFHYYAKSEMYPRVFGVGGATGRSKFTGWSPE